ncbi:hypothetical protein [Cellulophaga sp. Ld12]|uniref:hypothetical protein n=1 Tax=Cellulophaga sp. Ld12 TaxID=3229535 RepID=UPI0038691710
MQEVNGAIFFFSVYYGMGSSSGSFGSSNSNSSGESSSAPIIEYGVSEEFENEFSGNFKETLVSLKRGSINDKVDTICWDMIRYRITLNYRYIDNTTVIFFSKINEEY